MATQTSKRGLRKPEPSDLVNVVTDIDNNMDNLDDAVPDSRKVNGHALTSDVTVTKSDVGLGNVDNTSDVNKPVSTAQQTALDGKVPTTRTVNGHPLSADVTVTKSDVGLGNVDNTSDANKPISDAVAAKLGTVPSGKTLQGEIDATNSDVSDLKLAIRNTDDDVYNPVDMTWVQGRISPTNGNIGTSYTNAITEETFYNPSEYSYVKCNSGYKIGVFAYNPSNSSYVGTLHSDSDGFSPGSTNVKYVTEFWIKDYPSYKFKFSLHKSDDSDLLPSAGTNCKIYVFDAYEQINEMKETLQAPVLLDWDSTSGKYLKTDAGTIDTSNPFTTSASWQGDCLFVACSPFDVFVFTATGGAKYRPYIFCKSNGDIIEYGDNVAYVNQRIVAPQNAAYVGFNCIDGVENAYVKKGEYIFDKLQNEINEVTGYYKNKKCVAFGTSLTDRDQGYRPYLATMLQMSIDDQGDSSAMWYYYQDTNNVLYNVQHYDGYADKDICIIEGCVNDWGGERSLGTYKDVGTDSVCGCLYNMINHIYTQKPGIQIIVILDHFGKINGSADCSSSAVNSFNKTQYDYYEECAKLCEFYGIPVIKEYALSSIGQFGEQYLTDQIHCSVLGAKQSAETIGRAMMNIKPKVIT